MVRGRGRVGGRLQPIRTHWHTGDRHLDGLPGDDLLVGPEPIYPLRDGLRTWLGALSRGHRLPLEDALEAGPDHALVLADLRVPVTAPR